MSYNDDKRELLKLKQGIIQESETIKEGPHGDKAEYEVKGFRKKLANFFYHYKWPVIVIAFFAIVAFILVYSTVTEEKGDIRILLFSEDAEIVTELYYKSKDIEVALEQYTADYDENGYVHVDNYYINMNEEQDSNYYFANQSKLYAEVSLGIAQIYIGDKELLSKVLGDQEESKGFEDLSALYPDNPFIVDKYYYQVKGSPFAEAAMYLESCPDDLYIAVRSEEFEGYVNYSDTMAENHRRALEVIDNIINDRKVETETDE